jgi:hypothetical protein
MKQYLDALHWIDSYYLRDTPYISGGLNQCYRAQQ